MNVPKFPYWFVLHHFFLCIDQTLVEHNNLKGRIQVIPGRVEEVHVPEQVDIIISEPMGYMLFNERMLETYIHARVSYTTFHIHGLQLAN